MKTANPCRKNYRPEIDPYLDISYSRRGSKRELIFYIVVK